MKKILATLLLIFICFINSKAQYITIPDANLRTKLKQLYPSCFNANNEMDTQCNLIKQATSLSVDNLNISDLTGVQYFTSLKTLVCNNNKLTTLPPLPNTIENLWCNDNQLINLPTLPASLCQFRCYNNQLSTLPPLPIALCSLDCENNKLKFLPSLPPHLGGLYCNDNELKCLPVLPSSLYAITLSGNYITCLPNLPNSTFSSDIGKTICTSSNNSNDCALYPIISGKAFFDDNKNNIQDNGEINYSNAIIEVRPGNYLTQTDDNGNYSMSVDIGTFTVIIKAENTPYFTNTPSNHIVTFTNYGETNAQNDFALQPNSITNDLKVTVTSLGVARSGRSVGYIITYKNIGTTTIDGDISFDYYAQLNYDSTSVAFTNHTGNHIAWAYNNLTPRESRNIRVNFTIPNTIISETNLNFSATVNPTVGDYDPTNNTETFTQKVAGSFDPNFKEVLPVGDITPDQVESQDPFTYIVHFQNTGTDTAYVVSIKDTISTNFEILTIETLAASHNYSFKMKNGAVEWKFNNILLVDSITNEPLSHGFVKYRVIPKNSLIAGDKIVNTAHIFFDYNAPVITNTTLNKVTMPTSINPNEASALLNIYPNPSKGSATISYGIAGQGTIKVLGIDSRIVYTQNINFTNPAIVDLSNEPKGIYIIEVAIGENVVRKKLVMQ